MFIMKQVLNFILSDLKIKKKILKTLKFSLVNTAETFRDISSGNQ